MGFTLKPTVGDGMIAYSLKHPTPIRLAKEEARNIPRIELDDIEIIKNRSLSSAGNASEEIDKRDYTGFDLGS